jgi:dTDP-4-amino-4,6-dideoxygalactose transaminase
MPVHLFGHMVPFDLMRTWRRMGLVVVEDAAQAHLGSWRGQMVGSASDAACFSFYPGKNLGAFGDAGAVITGRPDVAERVALQRDHGRMTKYVHQEIGWSSRLDGIQAAVLETKLRHLAGWTAQRRVLAEEYRQRLGARLVPWEAGDVHHLLVIRVDPERRDAIAAGLLSGGIQSGVHYPVALTDQPALDRWVRSETPNARAAAASVLSLPMDPLMTTNDVERVCDVLDKLL